MLRGTVIAASRGLDRACRVAAALCVALMVILIAVQVVLRYGFDISPSWTEEAARYAMVWSGLLGAAIAFRMGVDPVLVRLERFETGAWRVLGAALRAFTTLLFLLPILWFCLFGPDGDTARGFLARSAGREAEALGVPLVWFTAALPVAIVVIVVHLAASLLGDRPKPAPDDPL